MPTDGKKQACGSWEQLDTEELLELVRMDLDPPEGGDYERTARILEVIERGSSPMSARHGRISKNTMSPWTARAVRSIQ